VLGVYILAIVRINIMGQACAVDRHDRVGIACGHSVGGWAGGGLPMILFWIFVVVTIVIVLGVLLKLAVSSKSGRSREEELESELKRLRARIEELEKEIERARKSSQQ